MSPGGPREVARLPLKQEKKMIRRTYGTYRMALVAAAAVTGAGAGGGRAQPRGREAVRGQDPADPGAELRGLPRPGKTEGRPSARYLREPDQGRQGRQRQADEGRRAGQSGQVADD